MSVTPHGLGPPVTGEVVRSLADPEQKPALGKRMCDTPRGTGHGQARHE